MTAENWPACQARLRQHEGGNDDDPRDPGGRTSRGIIQREWTDYAAHHPGQKLPADVWMAPDSAITDIYRTKYWARMRCDELPSGVDDTVYDYSVNSGVGRAGKVLRRVVGLPDSTSVVTDEVLAAAAKRDAKAIIIAINDERLRFLKSLKTWPVFGAGWSRRVADVRAFSLHLAEQQVLAPGPTPRPMTTAAAPAKGVIPPPTAAKKVIQVGGGGAAVGTAGGFHEWVVAHPIETGLLVLGIVVMIGGTVYAINRNYQARQDAPTPGIAVVPEQAAA
jgi:lysozyme family protein